jgi:hypothetical protein
VSRYQFPQAIWRDAQFLAPILHFVILVNIDSSPIRRTSVCSVIRHNVIRLEFGHPVGGNRSRSSLPLCSKLDCPSMVATLIAETHGLILSSPVLK